MKKLVLLAVATLFTMTAGLQTASACGAKPGTKKEAQLIKGSFNYGKLVDQTGDAANNIKDAMWIELGPDAAAVETVTFSIAGNSRGQDIATAPVELKPTLPGVYPINDVQAARGAEALSITLTASNGRSVQLTLVVARTRSAGCGTSFTVRP